MIEGLIFYKVHTNDFLKWYCPQNLADHQTLLIMDKNRNLIATKMLGRNITYQSRKYGPRWRVYAYKVTHPQDVAVTEENLYNYINLGEIIWDSYLDDVRSLYEQHVLLV